MCVVCVCVCVVHSLGVSVPRGLGFNPAQIYTSVPSLNRAWDIDIETELCRLFTQSLHTNNGIVS
jgi:hypothetical protein